MHRADRMLLDVLLIVPPAMIPDAKDVTVRRKHF